MPAIRGAFCSDWPWEEWALEAAEPVRPLDPLKITAAADTKATAMDDGVVRIGWALRKADIHVVALHNHMVGERPAYYFVHFWAKGPAEGLARGFKSVLDAQKGVKPE